jgi:hypothetical protein
MPGRLTFFTTASGASSVSERMRLDSTGRLGLGTSSPNELLEVAGNIHVSGADRSIFNRSNNALAFGTNNTERARIDSSGRLLVGTASARNAGEGFQANIGSQLFIEQPSAGLSPATFLLNRNDTNGPRIVIGKSRGTTLGSNTIVQSGDELGLINFAGADGTDLETIAAQIKAVVDGTPGANDMPGRLVFSVTADGASTPAEALRISNNRAITVSDGGNVVLGTTTGTKIGTATTQKLGFYNATPVVQPTAVADATDAATAISQLNALLAHMRTLGLIAT